MSEVIMQVKNITKKFPASGGRFLTACDNINLTIESGRTVGIVGESGCGKSTLVKTILNMHAPTAGEVIFHEQDITKLKGEAKRQNCRNIQMVFQDPTAAFDPKMKIADIICEPLLNFNLIKKSQIKQKARELLELVELPADFTDRYPNNMSGGQRQRVAIARALALEPEIIVCDEATSALDVSVQAKIIELLVKLQKEKNITYIFICHDLALVSLFSHRIAVMYLGNIVEKIDGDKLLQAKHPYTQALLKSIFYVDEEKNKNIETLTGEIPSPLDLPIGCPFQNRCKYCKDICKQMKPQLEEVSSNHFVACHLV
ncbi:ABC transporter ATP-binding protein [Megamonas hypermegale]|uniref:ABC transporter ATP-binding protein n=1 Tax=Megamonas hypermegale TaxID=158847 RepID=UPI0026EB4799|nr:ABC transporter ATP-binding protein [Megamonas hypermegale]